MIQSLEVKKLEEDDPEVCHNLWLRIDGLSKLCGSLIKEIDELKIKKEMACDINEEEKPEPFPQTEEPPLELTEDDGKIIKDFEENDEFKKIKEKIMEAIVETIYTSPEFKDYELEEFVNEDSRLNNTKITELLSRVAKKKFNGMVYGIISKKIAEKTSNAITRFENFFNEHEQQLIISTVQTEIRKKLPEIKNEIDRK